MTGALRAGLLMVLFGIGAARGAETDRIACGHATATMRTQCTHAGGLRCTAQSLQMQAEAGRSVAVPLAGHLVAAGGGGPALDYIVQSWACVTAADRQAYLLLDYRCGPGTAGCDDAAGEERNQVVTQAGVNLDARWGVDSARTYATLKRLGLADPPGGQQMQGLRFTTAR